MGEKEFWPAKTPSPWGSWARVSPCWPLAFEQESFETAVSSVSTSNRRWTHDPKTADGCYEQQQYKSCNKGRDDSSSSGVGPAYTHRSQESPADAYRRRGNDGDHDNNDLPPPSLPADDRRRAVAAADEPESPRVLPGVPPGSAAAAHPPGPNEGGGFTYPGGPIKHFTPSATLQQHKQQQLKKQRDSVGDVDGGGLPDRRLDDDDEDDGGGKEPEDEDDEDDDEDELSAEDAGPPDDELLPVAPVEKGNLARMRWHKAYNKIVHQLNVSTFVLHR